MANQISTGRPIVINSILRRFEVVAYKDKSSTDKAQVPTDATVDVYKQGSTYRGVTITISTSDPDPTPITVDSVGDYKVNDRFGKNNATAIFIVNAIIDRTTIEISSLSGSKTLSDNDRLIVTTDRPTLYSDSKGTTSTSNPQTADSATGRVSCYVRQKRFDYTVSGTGLSTRYFFNVEGGSIPESPHY